MLSAVPSCLSLGRPGSWYSLPCLLPTLPFSAAICPAPALVPHEEGEPRNTPQVPCPQEDAPASRRLSTAPRSLCPQEPCPQEDAPTQQRPRALSLQALGRWCGQPALYPGSGKEAVLASHPGIPPASPRQETMGPPDAEPRPGQAAAGWAWLTAGGAPGSPGEGDHRGCSWRERGPQAPRVGIPAGPGLSACRGKPRPATSPSCWRGQTGQ